MNCCQAMSWLVAEPLRPPLDPIPLFVPVPISGCHQSAQLSVESTLLYPRVNPEELHSNSPSKLASGAPFSLPLLAIIQNVPASSRASWSSAGRRNVCVPQPAPDMLAERLHSTFPLFLPAGSRSVWELERNIPAHPVCVKPLLRAAVQTKGCLFVCLFVCAARSN